MESKCSFFNLVGVICDYEERYPNSDTVPHHRVTEVLSNMLGVLELSDISPEVELILARVSTFSFPRNI